MDASLCLADDTARSLAVVNYECELARERLLAARVAAMSNSVADKIKADLSQRTRLRENDRLNDIIAEIGRSVKAGAGVRPNVWNELKASSTRYYNAEPKHVGPQTYRPRRAEHIVRKSHGACQFASASRDTNLVIQPARRPGDIARYYMAGAYQPDIKDLGAGPQSGFGRQTLAKTAVVRLPPALGGSSGGGGGTGKHQQRRVGATSPSFSMQARWKPANEVVDETYQPPLYSGMGPQVLGGFPSAAAVPFTSGRDQTYDAQHAIADAEYDRVGPQTYSPQVAPTKATAPSYSMAAGRGDMNQKVTNRGQVTAAVGSYELGCVPCASERASAGLLP